MPESETDRRGTDDDPDDDRDDAATIVEVDEVDTKNVDANGKVHISRSRAGQRVKIALRFLDEDDGDEPNA